MNWYIHRLCHICSYGTVIFVVVCCCFCCCLVCGADILCQLFCVFSISTGFRNFLEVNREMPRIIWIYDFGMDLFISLFGCSFLFSVKGKTSVLFRGCWLLLVRIRYWSIDGQINIQHAQTNIVSYHHLSTVVKVSKRVTVKSSFMRPRNVDFCPFCREESQLILCQIVTLASTAEDYLLPSENCQLSFPASSWP